MLDSYQLFISSILLRINYSNCCLSLSDDEFTFWWEFVFGYRWRSYSWVATWRRPTLAALPSYWKIPGSISRWIIPNSTALPLSLFLKRKGLRCMRVCLICAKSGWVKNCSSAFSSGSPCYWTTVSSSPGPTVRADISGWLQRTWVWRKYRPLPGRKAWENCPHLKGRGCMGRRGWSIWGLLFHKQRNRGSS